MRRPSSAGLSVVVAAILCVLAVSAAVVSAFWVFREPTYEPGKAWFYDLNTKELFVAPGSSIPPIEAPSGSLPNGTPAGVQAVVLEGNGEQKIAYLFTYPAEAKAQLDQMNAGDFDEMDSMVPPVRWVRAAEGGEWVAETTDKGSEIMNKAMEAIGTTMQYSIPK